MSKKVSIAEARNQFASLIHQVEEKNEPVSVTRRGEPVAVILSTKAYSDLVTNQTSPDFWQAYETWREQSQETISSPEPDLFDNLRDDSPGRTIELE